MRATLAVVLATLLVACASDDGSDATSTDPTTTVAAVLTDVQAVVDVGGGQVLGLAVDESSVWAVSFDTSTVAKIDPTTHQVSATVDIEGTAASVLVVGGDVWVVGYGSPGATNLYRIDAASAVLTSRFGVGELCCDLTYDGAFLWAVDPAGGLLQIDAATGDVVRRTQVDIDRNAHTNVVYAEGFVWVASDTTQLSFDVGGGVPFVARDGLLWGASPNSVWAVDAAGTVVERIAIPDSIEVLSLEVVGPSLWVGIRHPGFIGAVLHIQRSSGAVLQEFTIDIPARMAVGFDSLWITDSGSSGVYRIGPVG